MNHNSIIHPNAKSLAWHCPRSVAQRARLGQTFVRGRDGRSHPQTGLAVDVIGHRRGRVHWVERGREPQRGRTHRHCRQRCARQRRQMAQSGRPPDRRFCPAGGTRALARRAQARGGDPSRRHIFDDRDRRRCDHGEQFPAVAAPARLVRGERARLSSTPRRPRLMATASRAMPTTGRTARSNASSR